MRGGIALDDIQDLLGIETIRYALHHLDGLAELNKTRTIKSVSLHDIIV